MSTVTVPPDRTCCPRQDAITLRRAFYPDPSIFVTRCDKASVVHVLAHRNAIHRDLIRQEYEAMYSDDLLNCLSRILSGDLERSVHLWMLNPAERDARVVKQGLSSETENLQAATEVICFRTPSEIESIKYEYNFRYGVPLEDDIQMQASGYHKQLLLAYLRTTRNEGLESDTERAGVDSVALFKALGETDKVTFINIFSERNRAQLTAVISAYHDNYGDSLGKAVKGKRWGPFGYALWTILSCSKNPARYFAKVLHKAMKGLGTDDTTLIRVIVTRTEIDMQYIKAEYLKKYKKTLNDAVHSETSGHYRTFLLSLLGPNR